MPKQRLNAMLRDSDFDPPAQSWLLLSQIGGVLTAGAIVMGLCRLELMTAPSHSAPSPLGTVMIANTHP